MKRITGIIAGLILGIGSVNAVTSGNPADGNVYVTATVQPACKIISGYEHQEVYVDYDVDDTTGYYLREVEIKLNCTKGTYWTIDLDSMNGSNGVYYLVDPNNPDPNEKIQYEIHPLTRSSWDPNGKLYEETAEFEIRIYKGQVQSVGKYTDTVHVHLSYH